MCQFPADNLLALRKAINGQTGKPSIMPSIRLQTAIELLGMISEMEIEHLRTGCLCSSRARSRAAQGIKKGSAPGCTTNATAER